MVIGETDSVIRFGFLVEWIDAHFSGLGLNPLPRLAARCRGGSRRRGELRKVWDLACGFVQATKNRSPPPLTVARFGVLLPSAPSPSARRVRLFCLTPSLHIQMVG